MFKDVLASLKVGDLLEGEHCGLCPEDKPYQFRVTNIRINDSNDAYYNGAYLFLIRLSDSTVHDNIFFSLELKNWRLVRKQQGKHTICLQCNR